MGLGDEIMASAWARRAKQKNPDAKIFIGPVNKPEWSVVWENNPNINRPAEFDKHATEKVSWVPHFTGHRPYINGCTPGNIIYDEDHRPEPGDVFLTDKELEPFRKYAGSILIEPHIKGSFSGNKAWFWDRWQGVVDGLGRTGRVVQIGDRNKKALHGVERIHTGDFRQALAVVSLASLVITTDGALHHAAAALGKPAVVLWGARTHPKILGYDTHQNLYTGNGESCGSMAPCQHCMQAMKKITVEMVLEAARSHLVRN
jgi:ADP-heptose:LPS heptosyltransferase